MTAPPDRIVSVLPKNAREELRVSLTVYRGYQLLDLRCYTDIGVSGVRGPTKKGISVQVALLPELISALEEAQSILASNEAREHRLLEPPKDKTAAERQRRHRAKRNGQDVTRDMRDNDRDAPPIEQEPLFASR